VARLPAAAARLPRPGSGCGLSYPPVLVPVLGGGTPGPRSLDAAWELLGAGRWSTIAAELGLEATVGAGNEPIRASSSFH
jgi:hypothetical protein